MRHTALISLVARAFRFVFHYEKSIRLQLWKLVWSQVSSASSGDPVSEAQLAKISLSSLISSAHTSTLASSAHVIPRLTSGCVQHTLISDRRPRPPALRRTTEDGDAERTWFRKVEGGERSELNYGLWWNVGRSLTFRKGSSDCVAGSVEPLKRSGNTMLIKLVKSAGVKTFYQRLHCVPDKFSSDMLKEWT